MAHVRRGAAPVGAKSWGAVALLFFISSSVAFHVEDLNHKVVNSSSVAARLESYCHPKVEDVEEGRLSMAATHHLPEEKWGEAVALELRGVSAVIRHGDRTGLHHIPGTDKTSWGCNFEGEDETVSHVMGLHAPRLVHPAAAPWPPLIGTEADKNIDEMSDLEKAGLDVVGAGRVAWGSRVKLEGRVPVAAAGFVPGGMVQGEEDVVARAAEYHHPSAMPRAVAERKLSTARQGSEMEVGVDGSVGGAAYRSQLEAAVGDAAQHVCHDGMLTPTGIQQHVELGQQLRTQYTGLLAELESGRLDPAMVHVQSTDYARTALSGAAFLHGLFPDYRDGTPGAEGEEEVVREILVVPKESDVMLLGKAPRRCERAAHFTEKHSNHVHEHLFPAPGVQRVLARVSGCPEGSVPEGDEAQPVDADIASAAAVEGQATEGHSACPALSLITTSVADIITTRLCHGHPLPCNLEALREAAATDGVVREGACITEEEAMEILSAADHSYTREFNGDINRLMMYPMMHQIVAQLEATADPNSGISQNMWLRFAHDVVVYPLAHAFGALHSHDAVGHHGWPSYAARLVIEVWTEAQDEDTPEDADTPPAYARLLYNGVDVTVELDCSKEMDVVVPEGDGRWGGGVVLCPLPALRAQVEGALHGATDWEIACQTFTTPAPRKEPAPAPEAEDDEGLINIVPVLGETVVDAVEDEAVDGVVADAEPVNEDFEPWPEDDQE